MNRAAVLLWKEWRDQRALILTFALLGPIAIWAAQAVWLEGPGWNPVLGGVVLPALTALFAAVLAAEVLCTDFASGATDALGRLPFAPRALFAVKLGFVALATPLYLGWTLAAEAGRRALIGLDAALLIEQVAGAHGIALLGATTTAAVIACSVLLRRGFPSVLAGILLVLGSLAVMSQANDGRGPRWVQVELSAFGVHPVVGTVCLALLCTAVCGYSPWRRSRDVRRMVLAACGLGLVAVPALAAGAIDYAARLRMKPGDPVTIVQVAPSPDGRFVAMQVRRRAPWSSGTYESLGTVWILHLKTHEIRALARGSEFCLPVYGAGDSAWASAGELVVLPGEGGGDALIAWIDSDSGATVRSRPLEDYEDVLEELAPSWCRIEAGAQDAGGLREYTLRWPEQQRETKFTCRRRPRPAHTPGTVLYVDEDGALVSREWDGQERVLVSGTGEPARVRTSPDGTLAVFRRNGQDTHVIDVETGADVLEPGRWRLLNWTSRGPNRGVFAKGTYGVPGTNARFALVGPEGTRELEFEDPQVCDLCPMPSGDLLALRRYDGLERLELLDAEGALLDVLYEGPRLETR